MTQLAPSAISAVDWLLLSGVVTWLLLSIAVAVLAHRYRRDSALWLFAALFFSPVVGAAFVLALGPKARRQRINWRNIKWNETAEQAVARENAWRSRDIIAIGIVVVLVLAFLAYLVQP
jgi:hypothetical protein